MKYIVFLSLFFITCPGQPQEFGTIPQTSSIWIDGNHTEWGNVPTLFLSSSDSTITEGKGTFEKSSLELDIQVAWNEEDLYVAAFWEDDVLDVIDIPLDSVLWTGHPDGLRRDKMYYYDNLAIRLRVPNYFGYWLTPGNMEKGGLQHAELINPSSAIKQIDEHTFFIESKVSWRELGIRPSVGDTVNLQIIAPDSDTPSSSLLEKNPSTKYLLWQEDVVLGKQ